MSSASGRGSPTQNTETPRTWEGDRILDIYIHEYLQKHGYLAAAHTIAWDANLPAGVKPPIDSEQGLLFEWWTVFWVFFKAHTKGIGSEDALTCLKHRGEYEPQSSSKHSRKRGSTKTKSTSSRPPPPPAPTEISPPHSTPPLLTPTLIHGESTPSPENDSEPPTPITFKQSQNRPSKLSHQVLLDPDHAPLLGDIERPGSSSVQHPLRDVDRRTTFSMDQTDTTKSSIPMDWSWDLFDSPHGDVMLDMHQGQIAYDPLGSLFEHGHGLSHEGGVALFQCLPQGTHEDVHHDYMLASRTSSARADPWG